MSNDEKVLNYIDDHKDEIIGFMQRLIQTKSITGDESAIAALMAEESERDGLEVELVEPAENRVSVVARYKGTTGKPNVMMYTHYDVVPPGDPETWSHPPFSGEITDGWIWGRGARDNKIATCGIAMAFRAIKECGIKLKGDIIFTHVADEEKGGKFGYRVILDKGYGDDVDFLFYPHGGDGNQVGIAANGAVNYYIKVLGRSAHTSRLEDGINAVIKAAKLIGRLKILADEVNSRTFHLPGTDTIMKSRFSMNGISGYVANNNVPESCEIIIDRRYTPSETAQQTHKEIMGVIEALKAEDPEFNAEVRAKFEDGNPVSVSPADSDLVIAIQDAAEKVVGFRPKPAGGSHSSDHGWFVQRIGKPVASYGIGGEGGHSANERIKVEDVILTTKVYALTIMNIMGVA